MTVLFFTPYTTRSLLSNGQVAQLVERGPEKAGVGGSNPSLATTTIEKTLRGTGKMLRFGPVPIDPVPALS